MKVLDEYETVTKTSLYRKDDYWAFEPKNDFEEKIYYSKKMNQKDLIRVINEEIVRFKNKG